MIDKAIKFIVDEINETIVDNLTTDFKEKVIAGNISRLDAGTDASSVDLQTQVVLTLVNIEEEPTLKNNSTYIKVGENVTKVRPVLYLNLFLLFSCAEKQYTLALGRISEIIHFFQKKNVFEPGTTILPMPEKLDKIIVELYSTNFEQQNHLWGILGGKQLPSVMYKVRLVSISSQGSLSSVIKSIETNEPEN
jgi:Pvc16 N-terminal domain